MKQVLMRRGKIFVDDVPAPAISAGRILVEVSASLISTGTEMSTLQASEGSLLSKAIEKPVAVVSVLNSVRVRGVKRTLAMIHDRLEQAQALGYSCCGRVLAVGSHVDRVQIGDRVACAGAGLAHHAEIVSVPKNLAVKVPDAVSDDSAAFVTLGAIALQGVRRADVRLGESVAVIGLGLLGQLTVQLLKSAGCHVFGIDKNPVRVDLAKKMGLDEGALDPGELKRTILQKTQGQGVDACLLTASTPSSEPVAQAFDITRKKGRIVVVGAVGLELNRSPFYEKEQDFLISCSYGPGRYDATYEQEGIDYPYPYVRWTENRNMQAFLDLIAAQRIDAAGLIGKRYPVAQAETAYADLKNADNPPLAVVLNYPVRDESKKEHFIILKDMTSAKKGKVALGLIGVGEFVTSMHLPNLEALNHDVTILGVCSSRGVNASNIGERVKASIITTDYHDLLNSPNITAVLIGTRHDQHATVALEALKAGKHVYLEKPMALTDDDLKGYENLFSKKEPSPVFMVGFNRRFSPHITELKKSLNKRTSPLMALYRVNAGGLPKDHWTKTKEGGGRLKGEACHMFDVLRFLTGSPLTAVSLSSIHAADSSMNRPDENFSVQFDYEDGSVGTLIYTSLGHPSVSKERIEVFWEGHAAVLDDFKVLHIDGKIRGPINKVPDKGHREALEIFFNSIKTGTVFPIPSVELFETTQATIHLHDEAWGKPH